MCLLRITLASLCPNMIHFDEVDFSECRSEEVMFLLTLSVFSHTFEGCRNYTCVPEKKETRFVGDISLLPRNL